MMRGTDKEDGVSVLTSPLLTYFLESENEKKKKESQSKTNHS